MQVKKLTHQILNKKKMCNSVHKTIDLIMDNIFLDFLDKYPKRGPEIFYKLTSSLSGDEMASFMSGKSNFVINFKIIFKLPKYVFLKSLFRVFYNV